jgi:membrane associated rhomboid family serine protease
MIKSISSTYLLIGINLLVFGWLAFQQQSLMMNTNQDVLAIIRAGANLNPLTLGGQPWRIITSMFLHFGIIHLMVNMYALYILGKQLEEAMGIPRFLLLYFFCGISAGIASLLFNVFVPSAGASGALFGLFGYRLGAEIIGSIRDRKLLLNVFLNFLVFVVINAFIATTVNVDMAGHVGGFLGGILLAAFHFRLRWFIQQKFMGLLVLLLFSTLFLLPKDQVQYYQVFQRVIKAQDYTKGIYGKVTTDNALKDSLIKVLPVWDSISSSLQSLRRIPVELSSDTAVLKDYIQLHRLESYYKIKLIERESYVYYDSLEILSEKFGSLSPLKYVLNYDITEPSQPLPDTFPNDSPVLKPTKVYYDAHWKETDDISGAMYYRLGQKDSLDRWQGQVIDYYKNGEIQMKGKYQKDLKNGIFIYYSDHRTYESAGRYDKEQAVGKWESFHWNGALHSEVFYGDQTFTANIFDSLGNQQVVNGNGKSTTWYSSGQVKEEGTYRNGRKEGLWYGFHPDGKPYYKEQYRDNRLIHGVSEGKDGKRYVFDHLSEYPFPVDGMPAFKKYIDQHKRIPFLKTASGKVKIIFTVGVDGSTWNYVILQSVSPEFDQEAKRLIKEGPAWRPALLHGQEKIPSQGYIEIDF